MSNLKLINSILRKREGHPKNKIWRPRNSEGISFFFSSSDCNGDGCGGSQRQRFGFRRDDGGARARLRHRPIGVEAPPPASRRRLQSHRLRQHGRRNHEPRLLRFRPVRHARGLRLRPARDSGGVRRGEVYLRRPLALVHDRRRRLHFPAGSLPQNRHDFRFAEIRQRRRLLRRFRAVGNRRTVLGDGDELQVVGFRIRAAGGGRRHELRGGAGIQPHPVQHSAGHRPQRLPHDIHLRSPAIPGARDGPLPHRPELQGSGGSGGRRRVPPPEPRWEIHRRSHPDGGSSPPSQLAGDYDSGPPPPHSPRYRRPLIYPFNIIHIYTSWGY